MTSLSLFYLLEFNPHPHNDFSSEDSWTMSREHHRYRPTETTMRIPTLYLFHPNALNFDKYQENLIQLNTKELKTVANSIDGQ